METEKRYYAVLVKPLEDCTGDPETVISSADLRDVLERLHVVQRPDMAFWFREAAKAAGLTFWELARLKEALADATEILDGIADQIADLGEEVIA